MLILGIGGWLHDGAAALLKDGRLVAAMEEDKLRRQAHAGGLPERAVDACLAVVSATRDDVDCVAIARPMGGGSDPSQHLHLKAQFPKSRLVVVDHHVAHAASAYYPSPFDKARVVTLDRVGDMRCGARWDAEGTRIEATEELYAPDSPADFYSRVTQLLGYRAGAEEHKVQWLGQGGEARFRDLFLDVLGGANEHPTLDQSYFDASRPTAGGFSDRFYEALGLEHGGELSDQDRADIAASVQSAIEDSVVRFADEGENLCLGGGLMLNAPLVSAIEDSGRYKNIWVQPAAGNAGTSIGSAFYAWHQTCRKTERHALDHLFLGPEYDREDIKQVLENCKLRFRYLTTDETVIDTAVKRLNDNQIVAWFQGRMEFGSRALGNRSIFASPLNPYSTENLNDYIKRREPFRKFAASVPEEVAAEYFECKESARFLASISRVKEKHRKTFGAALLGDDRIRLHVVRRTDNPSTGNCCKPPARQRTPGAVQHVVQPVR